MLIRVHIGEGYVRTLFVSKEEKVCSSCQQELELPVLYCRDRMFAWHRHCFLEKVNNPHWLKAEREHEDLNIDILKVESESG